MSNAADSVCSLNGPFKDMYKEQFTNGILPIELTDTLQT